MAGRIIITATETGIETMPEYDPLTLARRIQADGSALPPVETWNPPDCGEIDLRITRDGSWHYQGTPIGRAALVRLFSTVLRRDADGHHYLVTPVEKIRIHVDDAPFVAVRLEVRGTGRTQELDFTTNVGDGVPLDASHPLRVEYDPASGEPSPYLRVRGRLDALVSRALFFELAELGEERVADDAVDFGVWSRGHFFVLGRLDT